MNSASSSCATSEPSRSEENDARHHDPSRLAWLNWKSLARHRRLLGVFLKAEPTTRVVFAARAKDRRKQLGLSGRALAERLGVTGVTLSNWEKRLPLTTNHDANWEAALDVPSGWLRDQSVETPALQSAGAIATTFPGTTIGAFISTMCTWYARRTVPDRTTRFEELSGHEQRLATIISRRYGTAGESNSTLKAIGDFVGLTSERIRQITDKAMLRFEPVPPPGELVERLHAAIANDAPFPLVQPPNAVQEVLGIGQSLEGADRFFREVLAKRLIQTKSHSVHEMMVVTAAASSAELARAVRQASMAMIRQAGAAHVFLVTGSVASQGLDTTPARVIECARMFTGFEWLSEPEGWFWYGTGNENRVRTNALKLLSVANRAVDIEELYGAMGRSRVPNDIDRAASVSVSVPMSILQVILAQFSEFRRWQSNDFLLACVQEDVARTREACLSPSELMIYEVLLQHGGIATRRALTRALVDSGKLEKATFDLSLFRSPAFRRRDRGLWTLSGYSVTVEAIQAAMTEKEQLQLVDGWYEVEVTLPRSAFERGDWFVPAATVPHLSVGEYEVQGFDRRTRYITNTVGDPYLKGFAHIAASAGYNVSSPCLFGVAAAGRMLRLRSCDAADSSAAGADVVGV